MRSLIHVCTSCSFASSVELTELICVNHTRLCASYIITCTKAIAKMAATRMPICKAPLHQRTIDSRHEIGGSTAYVRDISESSCFRKLVVKGNSEHLK